MGACSHQSMLVIGENRVLARPLADILAYLISLIMIWVPAHRQLLLVVGDNIDNVIYDRNSRSVICNKYTDSIDR